MFEGEYKNGQRYNGISYTINMPKKFVGRFENGLYAKWIEFFHDKIIFKGDYKNGKRYKGNEYNNNNQLIFQRWI